MRLKFWPKHPMYVLGEQDAAWAATPATTTTTRTTSCLAYLLGDLGTLGASWEGDFLLERAGGLLEARRTIL